MNARGALSHAHVRARAPHTPDAHVCVCARQAVRVQPAESPEAACDAHDHMARPHPLTGQLAAAAATHRRRTLLSIPLGLRHEVLMLPGLRSLWKRSNFFNRFFTTLTFFSGRTIFEALRAASGRERSHKVSPVPCRRQARGRRTSTVCVRHAAAVPEGPYGEKLLLSPPPRPQTC